MASLSNCFINFIFLEETIKFCKLMLNRNAGEPNLKVRTKLNF